MLNDAYLALLIYNAVSVWNEFIIGHLIEGQVYMLFHGNRSQQKHD